MWIFNCLGPDCTRPEQTPLVPGGLSPANLRIQERRSQLDRAPGKRELLLNDIVFSVSRLGIPSICDK